MPSYNFVDLIQVDQTFNAPWKSEKFKSEVIQRWTLRTEQLYVFPLERFYNLTNVSVVYLWLQASAGLVGKPLCAISGSSSMVTFASVGAYKKRKVSAFKPAFQAYLYFATCQRCARVNCEPFLKHFSSIISSKRTIFLFLCNQCSNP